MVITLYKSLNLIELHFHCVEITTNYHKGIAYNISIFSLYSLYLNTLGILFSPMQLLYGWAGRWVAGISCLACLVYKFLHSGHPKYFEPFLKPRCSVYRTRSSQSDGVLLEVPHCASIYKSKKHFGHSLAYDAPRIWNDLPDDVCSAKSLSSGKS